eukprot:TRINITY_DN83391_c0_g1_i1.p1 TRINITY_DN83391_c0_g1~~TRINITY_DN83391_c0_g1_i1.p1  ORF type:complete len:199 (+),score=12.51 TRINITY_DN83391_c0_g1_i1:110-706(+)
MPVIHRLLQNTEDEGLEKVREESVTTLTTIGVVAALVLSMERFSEKVEEDMDFPGDWLDCSEIPCNDIHVWVSSLSFMFCAHAVVFSTLVVCWLSMTPVKATRDFYQTFPNAMLRPSQSMMMGITCWAADSMWLAIIQHGTDIMRWVMILAFLLLGHVGYLFYKMRAFCWTWPNHHNAAGVPILAYPEAQPLVPSRNN